MSLLQGKVILGMVAVGGVMYGVSEADKSLNYVKSTATITEVKLDCFIKSGKKSVVKKDTNDMAYMDCNIAPFAAIKFGFDKSDVRQRAKIQYEFVSPVDNAIHTGKMTKEYGVEKYKEGVKFPMYAHKEEAGKSRVN